MINDEAPPLITSLGVLDMTVNDSTPDSMMDPGTPRGYPPLDPYDATDPMMDLADESDAEDYLQQLVQYGLQQMRDAADYEAALMNLWTDGGEEEVPTEVETEVESEVEEPMVDLSDMPPLEEAKIPVMVQKSIFVDFTTQSDWSDMYVQRYEQRLADEAQQPEPQRRTNPYRHCYSRFQH